MGRAILYALAVGCFAACLNTTRNTPHEAGTDDVVAERDDDILAAADVPEASDVPQDVPCSSGQTRCGDGMCTDPNFNDAHCGGCDQPACAPGRVCVVGRCIVDSVRLGLGSEHTCLINTSSDRACNYCWGNDPQCQLARATRTIEDGGMGDGGAPPCTPPPHPGLDGSVPPACGAPVLLPLRVAGLSDRLASISKGGSCAVLSTGDSLPGGRVICWGDNYLGQVGDGTWTRRASPVEVRLPGNPRVVQVASSSDLDNYTRCALTTVGEVYCWGANDNTQLGSFPAPCNAACISLSSIPNSCGPLPQRVRLPKDERFAQLAMGQGHVCGLTPTGRVFCWGRNDVGQLGIPASTNISAISARAALLPADAQVEQIVASASSTCALDRSGRVFCWGGQSDCLLGLGRSEPSREMPTPVMFPAGVAIRRLSMGSFIMLAVDASGRLWTWGRGGVRLASNTTSAGASCDGVRDDAGPVRLGTLTPVEADWFGSRRFVDVAAGYLHACAIDTDSCLWCWGQRVVPLGGQSLADSGVDMRVDYVGCLTGSLSCR